VYKDLFGRMLGYDLTFISQRYFFLLMICYVFFFFFFNMFTRVGGGRIRTCDLCFIRRGSQPIELPLGDDLLRVEIV
jgi:hypothetical protein